MSQCVILAADRSIWGPPRKDQELRQKDPSTKASILAVCTQKPWRSHVGTPKMLTRQLEVTLVLCGNPGLGPKQPTEHTGRPVWTVCWKFCYQHTSRNECEGRVCVCWKADGGLQLSLWQRIRLVPLWTRTLFSGWECSDVWKQPLVPLVRTERGAQAVPVVLLHFKGGGESCTCGGA